MSSSIVILNESSQNISVSNAVPQRIGLGNAYSIISGETYDGDYDIVPDFEGQTLACEQKLMRENVVIEPIAVHRTSNPQGGKTVYIGGNLDG